MRTQNTTGKGTDKASRRGATSAQQTTAATTPAARAQSTYSPKVEARRDGYERLAEAFVHMAVLATERAGSDRLDIEGPDVDVNDVHLSKALGAHLYALHNHLDWFDPRTLRKFYVEMRLWGDQLDAEGRAAGEAFRRESEGEQPRAGVELGAAEQGTDDADGGESPAHTREATDQPREQKSLTPERVTELVDTFITSAGEDEQARAFIELMQGVSDAAFVDRLEVEDIVLLASHRAYAKTRDFSARCDEFAGLARDDQ